MPLETVVGEDAAQIRMPGEQDAVEIVGLALEPLSAGKHRGGGRHRRVLVGCDADADALILARRQQVVDDVEAARARRVVRPAYIDERDELALHIVLQECQHVEDIAGFGLQRQFAIGDRGALYLRIQLFADIGGEVLESFVGHGRLPFDRAGAADLLLQEKHAVKQRLGGRRTAGHIDIDGNHAIAAAHHRIGIVVIAATIGA